MQFILYCFYNIINPSTHNCQKVCNCSRSKRSERTNQHREKTVIILRYMRLSMYMPFLEIYIYIYIYIYLIQLKYLKIKILNIKTHIHTLIAHDIAVILQYTGNISNILQYYCDISAISCAIKVYEDNFTCILYFLFIYNNKSMPYVYLSKKCIYIKNITIFAFFMYLNFKIA